MLFEREWKEIREGVRSVVHTTELGIDYEIRSLKKTKRFQTINRELQFEIFDKLPKVWNIVYGSNKLEESN